MKLEDIILDNLMNIKISRKKSLRRENNRFYNKKEKEEFLLGFRKFI